MMQTRRSTDKGSITSSHTISAVEGSSERELLDKEGWLCKDCHIRIVRERYSVCQACFRGRVADFANSGGMYVLTVTAFNKVRKDLSSYMR